VSAILAVHNDMVTVAQSAELWIVAPAVVGSSPIGHPIPGTSSVKHLEENVMGATIKLSREEFDALNQISE
jgi:aryl-alcohol dehydrogenase-like predicted oxidoreductase